MKNSGVFFHCLFIHSFIHSNVCWVPVCRGTSEDTPGSPYEPETQMWEAWGNRTSEQTRPPVCGPGTFPICYDAFDLEKKIKPSSNEVHCVYLFAYLRVYTWQSSREDFGWTQGISGERITKFGTCWPENSLWSDRSPFPTQPSSSERWRSHFQLALLLLLDFSSMCLYQRLLCLLIDFSDLAITSWLPAVKDKDVALLFCPFFQWNCIVIFY